MLSVAISRPGVQQNAPMGFFRSRTMLVAVAGLVAVSLFASMAVMFL